MEKHAEWILYPAHGRHQVLFDEAAVLYQGLFTWYSSPLRFPEFSRFYLYFSFTFFNISSRCSNEIFYVFYQITKMFVKCFFIRWFTDRGHRGNLSNWHHFLCSFCSTYDLVTEINLSPIKRKLLFRYAEKKYNNTWLTCSKHLIATVTL